MCSGFIAAATDTGKTGLKNQTADGLYYAVRYPSYMASATVRPEGARSIATMATRRGYQMGRWLAGRLMNEPGGLVSCQQPTHRYKRGGYEHVAISDYLERQFAVTGPNKVWCGDVTYIWTGIALGGVPRRCSRPVRKKTSGLGHVVLAGQQAHHESAGNGMGNPW